MKWVAIGAAGLLILLLACVTFFPQLILGYRGMPRRAAPAIDNVAGFADKFFVRCSIEPKRNVNRCFVYSKDTGKVICGRDFRLEKEERYARKDELKFRGFDGENILLSSGAALKPLMPCEVED